MSENGFIFPNVRGENQKYLSCHHPETIVSFLWSLGSTHMQWELSSQQVTFFGTKFKSDPQMEPDFHRSIPCIYTPENPHFQKEIHLHSWWIFYRHVSFRRCIYLGARLIIIPPPKTKTNSKKGARLDGRVCTSHLETIRRALFGIPVYRTYIYIYPGN